jgi:hypothetical protein
MTYNLYVTYPSGAVRLLPFDDPFIRGLVVIALADAPVRLRLEDRPDADAATWYAADCPPWRDERQYLTNVKDVA